ncbi:MAG: amino acid permease, partial [Pisciglobus halotolerans]|nr:amino acid permease [Pisciglobus halotolerans]
PALGVGSIDTLLKTLINMTAATSLIPVLFLLLAYIMMRVKQEDLPRSFKMGSQKVGITVGVMLLAFFLFAFVVSILPSPAALMTYFQTGFVAEGTANPLFTLLYNALGVIIFVGFAYVAYANYEKK